MGQSRSTYSKYDPRACLPFLAPSTTTQKAAGNFNLRKQGVQSPANLRSGKITSDLISTPVLVNTTNRKINDLQPTRNFIQSSSSSSNSDSDGSHKNTPPTKNSIQQPFSTSTTAQPSPAPKARPWVNDEKAKIYREQFAQRKAQEEKRRASIDIVEINPINSVDNNSAVITVQVPPPRFMSEETGNATSIFGENRNDSLIDFAPEPIARNSVLKQSISTRPISSLEELKMDNFTDDLLKTFNQISHNDTTSTYDNDTLSRRRKPEIAGENTFLAPQVSAPQVLAPQTVLESQISTPNQVPVPSPRNLSNETVPVPKPRTNWVQFD